MPLILHDNPWIGKDNGPKESTIPGPRCFQKVLFLNYAALPVFNAGFQSLM